MDLDRSFVSGSIPLLVMKLLEDQDLYGASILHHSGGLHKLWDSRTNRLRYGPFVSHASWRTQYTSDNTAILHKKS